MRSIFGFIFTLVVYLMVAPSLSGNGKITYAQKLNKQHAGVFLRLKEFVKSSEGEDLVRLVLHNNTRWQIAFTRLMEQALPGDISVSYTVEQASGCRDPRGKTDVVMETNLRPGKSISFTVPREAFQNGNAIYLEFAYSWETRPRKELLRNETSHRAYFSSIDLPSSK